MLKKSLIVLNGFIHDFAAGIWLASIVLIAVLDKAHLEHPSATDVLNHLERQFFWASILAMALVMATGAGRTFTYVENWYGENAERIRRRMLIIKHIILFVCFGAGYLWVFWKTFHS